MSLIPLAPFVGSDTLFVILGADCVFKAFFLPGTFYLTVESTILPNSHHLNTSGSQMSFAFCYY